MREHEEQQLCIKLQKHTPQYVQHRQALCECCCEGLQGCSTRQQSPLGRLAAVESMIRQAHANNCKVHTYTSSGASCIQGSAHKPPSPCCHWCGAQRVHMLWCCKRPCHTVRSSPGGTYQETRDATRIPATSNQQAGRCVRVSTRVQGGGHSLGLCTGGPSSSTSTCGCCMVPLLDTDMHATTLLYNATCRSL